MKLVVIEDCLLVNVIKNLLYPVGPPDRTGRGKMLVAPDLSGEKTKEVSSSEPRRGSILNEINE